MLDPVSGEDLQPPIIQLDGDVDRDFLGGRAQHLTQPVIHIEAGSRLVKAGFRSQPGILLLLERQRGRCQT